MLRDTCLCLTLLAASCVRAGEPDAVPGAIEARLSAMESAVLAGDPAAYMANIATADPEFHTEQRHWADDLKLHVPTAFDLSFSGVSDPAHAEGAEEVRLTMSWTMPGGRARSVEYPARFVDSDGRWLYAGEVWTVVGGDRVEALCAAGLEDQGRGVVEVFPRVRAHDEEGFELTIDRVQKVKLYTSVEHLQASIYLSYVDGLGGWNEPGEAIKLLASEHIGRRGYQALLAHEFGHVCTFEMGPHATSMPWWALEGAAELAAEEFSGNGGANDAYVRTLARTGRLGAWEKLSDFRSTPASDYGLVYPQGHHMLSFISGEWGRTKRNTWLRAMAQGRTIDQATTEVLGLSFADLDTRWRASLDAQPGEARPKEGGQEGAEKPAVR
jgi:hypothetical protein